MKIIPPTREKLGSFRPPFGGTCRARRPRPFDFGLCGPARPATHRTPSATCLTDMSGAICPSGLLPGAICPWSWRPKTYSAPPQRHDPQGRGRTLGTRQVEEQVSFLQLDLRRLPDPSHSAFLPPPPLKDNSATQNDEITLHVNGNNYT